IVKANHGPRAGIDQDDLTALAVDSRGRAALTGRGVRRVEWLRPQPRRDARASALTLAPRGPSRSAAAVLELRWCAWAPAGRTVGLRQSSEGTHLPRRVSPSNTTAFACSLGVKAQTCRIKCRPGV